MSKWVHARNSKFIKALLIRFHLEVMIRFAMKVLLQVLVLVFCITVAATPGWCTAALFLSPSNPGGATQGLFTSALFTLTGNLLTIQFDNPTMPLSAGSQPFLVESVTTPWDNSTPEFWDLDSKVGICVQMCGAGTWTYTRSESGASPSLTMPQGSASSLFKDSAANIVTYNVVLPSRNSMLFIDPIVWTSAPDFVDPVGAPEPAMYGLIALSLAGFCAVRLRRRG